jgi:hypothetical protein
MWPRVPRTAHDDALRDLFSWLNLGQKRAMPNCYMKTMHDVPLCAVQRCRSSGGASPPRQRSLQPVAIGAAMEVTTSPKPSMQRTARRFCEQAGRNLRERRAGLENVNVGADPARGWGRPLSQGSGERLDPACGPTGVRATACLHMEIGRNTGDPRRWVRDPTGRPRGIGRAAWGVGEVHSTVETG